MSVEFFYIPATQYGFTLQKGDDITRRVHETQAVQDAHDLFYAVGPDIILDELAEWIEFEGADGDYASRLLSEVEELIES